MSYNHLISSVEVGPFEPIAGEVPSPPFEPVPASRGYGDIQELCQRCAPINLDEIFSRTRRIYGDGVKLLKLSLSTFASVYFTRKQNRNGRSCDLYALSCLRSYALDSALRLMRSSALDILLVFAARLIANQPENHVFSQPPGTYSRISTAPPPPSCGYTRIKGRPLIEPLADRAAD